MMQIKQSLLKYFSENICIWGMRKQNDDLLVFAVSYSDVRKLQEFSDNNCLSMKLIIQKAEKNVWLCN